LTMLSYNEFGNARNLGFGGKTFLFSEDGG